ncbi:MAG: RNA-protein complex protein Nop10 [Candidatus Altiarchaeota archaeon]|nr:RNA-protein complex protein Nop10 [Candidatus Altiarchaeota archaeon]
MGMLRKCKACEKYSLADKCQYCGKETRKPAPPKFSPDDRYWKYRMKTKGITE